MSKQLTVKAFLREKEVECRRFTPTEDQTQKIEELKNKLKQIFPQLQDNKFTITYKDQEGDDIVVSTDEELVTSIMDLNKRNEDLFKISIHPQSSKQNSNQEKGENTPSATSCGSCKTQLTGIHFRCLHCPSYCLCYQCESQGEHQHHNMVRLPHPQQNQDQVMEILEPWIQIWKNMMQCNRNKTNEQNSNEGTKTSSEGQKEGHSHGVPPVFNFAELFKNMSGGFANQEEGACGVSKPNCNNCENTLTGANFKCLQCDNYHLCVDCEGKGLHNEHNMVRLSCPVPSQEELMKNFQPWISMWTNLTTPNCAEGCSAQEKCQGAEQSKDCKEGKEQQQKQKQRQQQQQQQRQQNAQNPMFGLADIFNQFCSGGCSNEARQLSQEQILHQILTAGTAASEMFNNMGPR